MEGAPGIRTRTLRLVVKYSAADILTLGHFLCLIVLSTDSKDGPQAMAKFSLN